MIVHDLHQFFLTLIIFPICKFSKNYSIYSVLRNKFNSISIITALNYLFYYLSSILQQNNHLYRLEISTLKLLLICQRRMFYLYANRQHNRHVSNRSMYSVLRIPSPTCDPHINPYSIDYGRAWRTIGGTS